MNSPIALQAAPQDVDSDGVKGVGARTFRARAFCAPDFCILEFVRTILEAHEIPIL